MGRTRNDAATEVTSELLATGEATMSQIAQLFDTDAKTLPKRMKGLIPRGRRHGYKTYSIADAAARLVKPSFEIEDFIRQMSPQEMSPLLLKEFWNGQRARLNYEVEMGNYWPTEDVVSAVALMQGEVRTTLLLASDTIEREVGVTDGQRKVFRRIIDSTIAKMKENVSEAFKDYVDRGTSTGTTDGVAAKKRKHRRVPDSEDDEEVDI